jgi:protein O-mannosyl-transferase
MARVSRQVATVRLPKRKERQAKMAKARQHATMPFWSIVSFALVLVFGTLILYSPVRTHDFINYDDRDYVLDNPHVTSGLSWETVRWSLTTNEQANWHPVTWLSHALDCQLFGLDAGAHHIVSLLIHVLNVLLLFLLLHQATGALGRSFLVAAMFGWHPFNVQSVAWIAERKNLLSTLFFLLSLAAYIWYARNPQRRRLAMVTTTFVLALASKPMAVSLPFVLLLLDYWPLQRIAGWTHACPRPGARQHSFPRLLLEKMPLFMLAAASCVVTVWAQRAGGALRSLQAFPLGTRISNALDSYVIYVIRTLWPFGFALYHPFSEGSIPVWKPILAAACLLAVSFVFWKQHRTRPYLLVGWLWFLGALVPVIGIVQVGDQAMADRYAYLPLIGLFIVLVWGFVDLCDVPRVESARWAFASIALLTSCFLTIQQLGYWQNSETIWSHALQVTKGNLLVEKQLANALVMSRETEQALPHLVHISKLDPTDVVTHVNLGASYASQGRLEEASREFEQVIRLTDHKTFGTDDRKYRTSAFMNLGFAYTQSKDYSKALVNFEGAGEFDPGMVDQIIADFERSSSAETTEGSHLRLSLLLQARGKYREARALLVDLLKLNPEYKDAKDLLDYLCTQPSMAASPTKPDVQTGLSSSTMDAEYER